MNTIAINKVHTFFVNTLVLNNTDAAKLKYMLEIIINDSLKLLIMFCVFCHFGYAVSFLYSLTTVFLIRTFTGGLHFKTFLGCILFSSFFFSICIYFITNVFLTPSLLIILYLTTFIIMVLLAPITPSQRPRYSEQKIMQFKLVGATLVILHFLMYFITNKNPYFTHSTWVLFFQSIQLFIAYRRLKQDEIKRINKTAT